MESQLRDAKGRTGDIPNTLKEQIVLEHTPLIRYIVNRIAVRLPSHIDLDDLHNTGVIGLMDAIEKYDPEKNCKFKTYAEFRIKGAILDQLRSLDWVPRSVRQKGRRLERAYGEVEQRLGRSASEEEVADSLGLQIEKFHELLNQVYALRSQFRARQGAVAELLDRWERAEGSNDALWSSLPAMSAHQVRRFDELSVVHRTTAADRAEFKRIYERARGLVRVFEEMTV